MTMRENILWHTGELTPALRARAYGHKGVTAWLTGLSGSGKSTIAARVERLLVERRVVSYVLDGDNIRHGLNHDLDFSPEGRSENVRRIGEVTKLFVDAGVVVLAAFVSPYRIDRARVRALHAPGDFFEVYVEASLEGCKRRDPKGLYEKAQAGSIADFTGISSPYETPEHPELTLRTELEDVDTCAHQLVQHLQRSGYVPVLST
ncbi:MAG: adenylyl-sulfate kinase [Myxococcales bacterium]|nr:adenylyl-sulfate kinase [Myxococcales bacterium]MCB9708057.1 adenylyl-sulfate kinase [Myxococcales bacterium]